MLYSGVFSRGVAIISYGVAMFSRTRTVMVILSGGVAMFGHGVVILSRGVAMFGRGVVSSSRGVAMLSGGVVIFNLVMEWLSLVLGWSPLVVELHHLW